MNSHEYVILSREVLSDDVSQFSVPLHVLADEDLFVRAKMTNHRLGDVITVYLLPQLTNQHPSLLAHLLHLTLHTHTHTIKQYTMVTFSELP